MSRIGGGRRSFVVRDSGVRLDRFVASGVEGLGRARARDLAERGRVLVDGAAKPPDYRLRSGELVEVELPACAWAGLSLDDRIIAEDEAILVLDKPAGLLMHPVKTGWLSTPEALLAEPEPTVAGLIFLRRLAARAPAVAPERCGLVHRLDRQTSGALVAAKTLQAQAALAGAFAGRRVDKAYRAVVLGRVERSVEVDAPLRRRGRRPAEVSPWGREARTLFSVVGRAAAATLVEARPLTGRTHQIRAHLAFIGHPVIGDPDVRMDWAARLEAEGLPPAPRMLLHAFRLAFDHPATGARVEFRAPLPGDFRKYWAAARRARGPAGPKAREQSRRPPRGRPWAPAGPSSGPGST